MHALKGGRHAKDQRRRRRRFKRYHPQEFHNAPPRPCDVARREEKEDANEVHGNASDRE